MLKTALEILSGNCSLSLSHINIFLYLSSIMAIPSPPRLALNITETQRQFRAKFDKRGQFQIFSFV